MFEPAPWFIGLSLMFAVLIFIASVRLSILKQRIRDTTSQAGGYSSSIVRIVVQGFEDKMEGWRTLLLVSWIGVVLSLIGVVTLYV